MSDNTGKVSDQMFDGVAADPKTQAVIDRLTNAVNTLGVAVTTTLPPRQRMFQVLCRALAHQKVAPEYEAMLSNIAVLLALQDKMTADIEKAANTKSGDQLDLDDSNLLPAVRLIVGAAHNVENNASFVSITQTVALADGLNEVMTRFPTDEARRLAQGIIDAADQLDAKTSIRVN